MSWTVSAGFTRRVCLIACVLVSAGRCPAGLVWFDETNGGAGYGSFDQLVAAHRTFLGEPDEILYFVDLNEPTKLSAQYAAHGVSFANTAGAASDASGVRREGGIHIANLTGYDGSYMPDGQKVYMKLANDDPATPFSILFDRPVSAFGAFLATGSQGNVHTFAVSFFDASNALVGRRSVQSWLWESKTRDQNYESLVGARATEAAISRVEILDLGRANSARTLIIDNIEWSRPAEGNENGSVPEPAACLTLCVGGLWFCRRVRRLPA